MMSDNRIERLEKIMDMMHWNLNQIMADEDLLKKPDRDNHWLFCNRTKVNERLQFRHKVRVRLIGMWNKELNNLKINI